MDIPSELKAAPYLTKGPADFFWKPRLPILGILAALLAFTGIAVSSFFSINNLEERAGLVEHTYKVLSVLEETFSTLKDTRSSARNFIISGNPKLLEPFQLYSRDVIDEVETLRRLTADKPERAAEIAAMKMQVDDYVAYLRTGIKLRQDNTDFSKSMAYLASDSSERFMGRIRTGIKAMQSEENTLLAVRSQAVEHGVHDTKILIVFGTAGAYLMLGGAFLLLGYEIRERQRADQALMQANESLARHASQLETTNKELESFSYSVSHDLRIPLRAVSGYARMLEEDYADKVGSEGMRLLKVVRDSSKRMGELIDDLLAFSRLGRHEISASDVDMMELVLAVIEEVQRKEDYPAARVVVDPLPPAWGDRALLQQVWTNLIANALKYSSTKEHPVIRIGGARRGAEIIYSVNDNGVGFNMQYYGKLFGVFQRLHSEEEFPGTGVGLAIVQRVVSRHGGRVWAESVPDQGATFFFALPLRGALDA